MGILLDTVEDDDEAWGERLPLIKMKLGIPEPQRIEYPHLPCPICSGQFFEEELNNHILYLFTDKGVGDSKRPF